MSDRNTLRLDEARQLTPPVNPVEAMRRQLALALFDGVKEQDLLDMAGRLKEMAMAGDLKAMQLFFKLVLPAGEKAAPPPPQDGAGLKAMADALRDLVDEIRVNRARDDRAVRETVALPPAQPAANGKGGGGAHDD